MSGVGASAGGALLTPYHVGVCALLLHYAEGSAPVERTLFELLLREVQAAKGPRQRSLRELQQELAADPETTALWEVLMNYLRIIDSPDALFEVIRGLQMVISQDIASTSPVHASGIFGQFARCCILAFKDASFEATVKLYDAIRDYVVETDRFVSPCEATPDATMGSYGKEANHSNDNGSPQLAMGTLQVEQLAQGLLRDLPLSFGRVPFPVIDKALKALHEKMPLCHMVHFLRYVNSLQHRLADDAGSRLRSFHDGHQQRGLAEVRASLGWSLGVPPEDGLPDLIQHASLALAGLHCEMRHIDDALQAIDESIRAAQEASDGGCLCACLYMLSRVLLQAGLTGKAFTMMRRCLHRSEALGLPMLQAICCLSIAHTLSLQPGLSDWRKRGLLWKEPLTRSPTEVQPAMVLRAHGTAGNNAASAPWPGTSTSVGAGGGRSFGFLSSVGVNGGARGGLTVLAALMGLTARDEVIGDGTGNSSSGRGEEWSAAAEGAACRDALAHVTLASYLSTHAGPCEARPRVLLCQAEVARLFGLQPLTVASCGLVLDVYRRDLNAEDRALAVCQLAAAASERSVEKARPLLRGIAHQLPHTGHLWAHIVGPKIIQILIRSGECAASSALLFQAAGIVRAVPHGSEVYAAQRLRVAANSVRLYHQQLLPAYGSAREAVEKGAKSGTPGDICSHLLCLTDVLLEAGNPVGALGPCLRCLSSAENSRLLQYRAEALVRLARVKLEMRDLVGALQLAEEVTPQVSASGSSRLRGEALTIQADVLFALMERSKDDQLTSTKLLKEAILALQGAAQGFGAVADLNPLRRCYYLLARACHQVGNVEQRNQHAARFRQISEFLDGGGRNSWDTLDLGSAPRPQSSMVDGDTSEDHGSPGCGAASHAAGPDALLEQAAVWACDTSCDHGTGATLLTPPPHGHGAVTPSGLQSPNESMLGSTLLGSHDVKSMDNSTAAPLDAKQHTRCPALAQLLALADISDDTSSALHRGDIITPTSGRGAVGVGWLSSSLLGNIGDTVPTDDVRVPTAIGNIKALYPMAAVLGA